MADRMEIKVSGLGDTLNLLDVRMRRNIPMAVAQTLTRVAMQSRQTLIQNMKRTFDNPTGYTLASIYVRMATPQKPTAEIFIKDEATKGTPPIKYLFPEVFGGKRNQKRSEKLLASIGVIEPGEYLVPWKVRLNPEGNVSSGIIQRVLSGMQAQQDGAQNSPAKGQGYAGTRGKRKVPRRYFSVRRHNTTIIFERTSNHITPLLLSRKTAKYKKRFRFYEILESVVPKLIQVEFLNVMKRFGF